MRFVGGDNLKKKFILPINRKEDVKEVNSKHGDKYKTTEEHFTNIMDKIQDMIEKCGDEGGWYVNDCIEINIEVKYQPEDK